MPYHFEEDPASGEWRLEINAIGFNLTATNRIESDEPLTDDYVLVDDDSFPGPSSLGGTVLHELALAGNDSAIRSLLQQLRNQDQQLQPLLTQLFTRDFDGSTPLHVAVRSGCKSVIELLLRYKHFKQIGTGQKKEEARYFIEGVDNFGLTPLHLAVRLAEFRSEKGVGTLKKGQEIKDIIQLFLNHGANVCAGSAGGQTPLSDAAHYEDREPYEMLLRTTPAEMGSMHEELNRDKDARSQDWNRVRAFMSATFWDPSSITRKSQAFAYSAVWSICTAARPLNLSSDLYTKVETYIIGEVHEIAAAAARLPLTRTSRDELAQNRQTESTAQTTRQQFYCRTWNAFKDAARHRDHCLRLLNRHWVKRTQDEASSAKGRLAYLEQKDAKSCDQRQAELKQWKEDASKEVHEIQKLHYVLWKNYVIDSDPEIKKWLQNLIIEDPALGKQLDLAEFHGDEARNQGDGGYESYEEMI